MEIHLQFVEEYTVYGGPLTVQLWKCLLAALFIMFPIWPEEYLLQVVIFCMSIRMKYEIFLYEYQASKCFVYLAEILMDLLDH